MKTLRFNEKKLREEIARVWGPYGAHVEVFDMILLDRSDLVEALGIADSILSAQDLEGVDGSLEVIKEVLTRDRCEP